MNVIRKYYLPKFKGVTLTLLIVWISLIIEYEINPLERIDVVFHYLISTLILTAFVGFLDHLWYNYGKPRRLKKLLNYENIKKLRMVGLILEPKSRCFFGVYRGYFLRAKIDIDDAQESFLEVSTFTRAILFDKINSRKIKKKYNIYLLNAGLYSISKNIYFEFGLFPKLKKLKHKLDKFIDNLYENNIETIGENEFELILS